MRCAAILAVLALASTGCVPADRARPSTSLEFDNGAYDSWSSRSGRFVRNTCTVGDQAANVVLPRDELDAIGELAVESGFFSLPAELDAPGMGVQPDGTIVVAAPCSEYRLRIRRAGRTNEVAWQCAAIGEHDAPPPQLAALVGRLRHSLYSRPEVQALPASGCIRY